MRFRIIDQQAGQILVRDHRDEADKTIDILLGRLRAEGPGRWLMRKLQCYRVHLSEWYFRQLQEGHLIEDVRPDIGARMEATSRYDQTLGCRLSPDTSAAVDLVLL